MYFRKYWLGKVWLDKCLKKPCFRGPLEKQQGKWVETLLQSAWQHLYNIYYVLWRQFHWKKSLLVIHKILRLFLKTLRVNEKLYLVTTDNLTETIQIQLSKKQKIFCQFFFAFLKSILNFTNLQRKMNLIADVFPEILPPKDIVR